MPKFKVWISHTVDYVCEIEADCEDDVRDNWPTLTNDQQPQWDIEYDSVQTNDDVGVTNIETVEEDDNEA